MADKKIRRRLCIEHLLVCGALVVGFFLTWIDWWFIELHGYQIPLQPADVVRFLGNLGDLADEVNADEKAQALWLIYLIPIGALFSMFGEAGSWARGRSSGWLARAIAPLFFVGAIVSILVFYLSLGTWIKDFLSWLLEPDAEPFSFKDDIPWDLFGPGIYVTVIGFLASLVTVWTVRSPKHKQKQAEKQKAKDEQKSDDLIEKKRELHEQKNEAAA